MYAFVCVLSSLLVLVLGIGYVTARINFKNNCAHFWENSEGSTIRCTKCNKKLK